MLLSWGLLMQGVEWNGTSVVRVLSRVLVLAPQAYSNQASLLPTLSLPPLWHTSLIANSNCCCNQPLGRSAGARRASASGLMETPSSCACSNVSAMRRPLRTS